MKLAFFVSSFPIRSETFILTQIAGLLDRGHEVHIYANEIYRGSELHTDFQKYALFERTRRRRTVTLASPPRRLLARMRLLLSVFHAPALVLGALNFYKFGKRAITLDVLDMALCFADRPAYDVVHCHFGPNGDDAAILMELGVLRGKLVATFHSYDVLLGMRSRGKIYRRLVRHADAVHSISEYNRKWLESFGFPRERIHYHPMGIHVGRFTAPRCADAAAGEVRILTVARLAPEKGLDYGLQAIAAVQRQHPQWRLRYRVIGGGELAGRLAAQVEQLGLADVVELSGAQDQEVVRAALLHAHVFFLPSLAEALPIAIMEAMACGLPVIATDVGGVAELVRTGETGRLVPPADVAALEVALTELLGCTPAERRRMGEAGRALVAQRHDTAALMERLVEHYSMLAAGEANAPRDANASASSSPDVARLAPGPQPGGS